ncbi:HlpA protein [Arcticibacter svalbardensis MN12-7]|uniref:HlpA protein n=1 Tax=Arcticibacter svalbardensis MN12-7 TaxID=1150600 RepID=R9GYB7_9SPHI|nr:hypothetical protein [Arcticibacter svalbardensis]EOR93979.1 HlpA protein [Arcticibacter svalbardensis MN12-7]
MPAYQTTSPVLFLIFNRPDTTQKVFEQICEAKPARLYIAADGPRRDREGEDLLCREARKIIENINWPCEIKTLFREQNMGAKDAVSDAIRWFFDSEEEGIILEDDCLPNNSFFYFCDTLLEKYRYDARIGSIGGCNLQHGRVWGDASYYFSKQVHIWGWASWRRVWKDYDKELVNYNDKQAIERIPSVFNDPFITKELLYIFHEIKEGKGNYWDYQFAFTSYFNSFLCIVPNINLITNIGFGEGATHTFDISSTDANIPSFNITEITHPEYIMPENEADYIMVGSGFNIDDKKRKYKKLTRRLKRWLKISKSI